MPAVPASLAGTHFEAGMHAGPTDVSQAEPVVAAERHVPVTGVAPASLPASSAPASVAGITHVPLVPHLASPPFTSPHVPAPVTTVFCTHMLVAASHASSSDVLHPGLVACFGSHAAPTVLAAAWQAPGVPFFASAPTQLRPIPQGAPLLQLAPAAPSATQVPAVQTSPPRPPQSASTPQASPPFGTAAHAPQVEVAGTAQKVLAHCELARQEAPFATDPARGAQAATGLEPRKSAHVSAGQRGRARLERRGRRGGPLRREIGRADRDAVRFARRFAPPVERHVE